MTILDFLLDFLKQRKDPILCEFFSLFLPGI